MTVVPSMNEPQPDQPDAPRDAGPLTSTAGALLRQAREAAGLHIGALSVALKVPVKKIEALEADRLDLLPDAVFARALAASVCRTLKVDPGPILARLPEQVMPLLTLESSTTNHASLDTRRAFWHAPALAGIPRPVLVVTGALVLAALVLFFLPSIAPAPSFLATDNQAPADSTATGAVAPADKSVLQAPAALVVSAPQVLAAVTQAVVSPPAAASAAVPMAPAAAPNANKVETSLLLLKAKSESWVQVTDASGVVQLRRIVNPGESVPVSGTLPFAVVVGRADAIDVLVRGQPFDMAPLARDNIARFQIK